MPIQVALIADDPCKDSLTALVHQFTTVFSRYQLIATAHTGGWVQQATGLPVTCLLPRALGGDVEIAARVCNGQIGAVICLVDATLTSPPPLTIQTLWRVCNLHGVPLATNLATAEAVVIYLAKARVGHLIFNPVAGQGNPDQDLALIRRLLEPQVQVQVILTQPDLSPADQARQALNDGSDVIIACGGDGTVSEVASAVLETGIPLGIIPRGTANAFANALGIPTAIPLACDTILAGHTQVVDGARCNGRGMVLLAGVGFEADYVNRANRELKNRFGPLAYILAGVQQWGEAQNFEATLELEGAEHGHGNLLKGTLTTSSITVANAAPATSVLAQGFGRVDYQDGLLDITVGTSRNRLQGIGALTSLFAAALVNSPTSREDILCLRASRLRITTESPRPVVIDGEIMGTTPVEIECIPQALTVLTPITTPGWRTGLG